MEVDTTHSSHEAQHDIPQAYYIMPSYGKSLADAIQDHDFKLTPESVLSMALQLLSILERIHVAGFVYNDLKPDNILVDERGQIKLIDFGLATRYREKDGTHIQGGQ